jgi:multiple sugar transport system permease protein
MASAAQRRIKSISYAKYGYLFILPFIIVYFIFQFYPLINTFIVSFHGNGTEGIEKFVGLDNYKAILFGSSKRAIKMVHQKFFSALLNTVILWVGNFIPQITLSMALAVWFTEANTKIRGEGIFKIIMYLPNIITAASIAVLFLQLCGEAENAPGVVNLMLNKLHIVSQDPLSEKYDTIKFITGKWQSRGVVMFIQTWMWFGNTMILLMTGILKIDKSIFEAANVDGASSWQTFMNVTVPSLKSTLSYTLITSMIGGLQMFDIPFLYHKDPNKVSDNLKTVAVYIYEYFHDQVDPKMGYAGAASVILFIITVILGCIALYAMRDEYEIKIRKATKKSAKQAKLRDKQFGGF